MARITKDPEIRRNELMDLAEQLFVEKGYDHTSASDIIKRAGVAQGTLYYYFKSKDEILEAIIDRYFQRFSSRVKQIVMDDSLDARQKLLWVSEAKLAMTADKMRLGENVCIEFSISNHKKYKEYARKETLPLIQKIVEQGIAEGVFKVDYPQETAELLILLSEHIDTCLKTVKSKARRARKIKATWALMEKALGTKPGTLF